jgi:hypothetical protein
LASFVIIEEPPRENNRPIGENSPNLVTLFTGDDKALVGAVKVLIGDRVAKNLSFFLKYLPRLHIFSSNCLVWKQGGQIVLD